MLGKPPLHPNPHITPQQETRSSADKRTFFLPPDAMHTRSDIDSTAPNAQQDPHEPWSLISLIVGQFGHWVLASNSAGTVTLSSSATSSNVSSWYSGLLASG
uniref:Uncharacterized protein n=1 Tax=Cacopsylla melanoneura TaxID=428564 RepID=A0A8D9A6V2_9HEMI